MRKWQEQPETHPSGELVQLQTKHEICGEFFVFTDAQ